MVTSLNTVVGLSMLTNATLGTNYYYSTSACIPILINIAIRATLAVPKSFFHSGSEDIPVDLIDNIFMPSRFGGGGGFFFVPFFFS